MVATINSANAIANITWPQQNLDKALTLLALGSGLASAPPEAVNVGAASDGETRRVLAGVAAELGLALDVQTVRYQDAAEVLSTIAPALLPLDSGDYIVVLRSGRLGATLLNPDGTTRRVSLQRLRQALFAAEQEAVAERIQQQLAETDLADVRREAIAAGLEAAHLHDAQREGVLRLVAPTSGSWWRLLRDNGLPALLGVQLGVRVVWYVLFFLSLTILAGVAVSGLVDWALLGLGVLLWLSRVPLALFLEWSERWLALKVGFINKHGLFNGALNLPSDAVTQAGPGRFLSWLLGSDRLIEAWLNRGAWFVSSGWFLLFSGLLLLLVGDAVGALLVWGWVALSVALVSWLSRRYRLLDERHTDITSRLLERLQGHSTRLVQEQGWHDASDRELAGYLRLARQRDATLTLAWTWLPYAWLLLIVLTLAPDFINNPAALLSTDPALTLRLAILLFTINEVQFLSLSLPDVARMIAAWSQMQPLRAASQDQGDQPGRKSAPPQQTANSEQPLLSLRNVQFSYPNSDRAVLSGIHATLSADARIVLRGPSGSGKSTLAGLLSGLRNPQNGLILLDGYDLPTIGVDDWRQRVVLVPQFYTNHLFDASLAFNVLMGQGDTDNAKALESAESVCRELGLGPLIEAMPNGMQQHVGVNGWQLSHGERNRVFIARALLQGADLTIFDESFAALDPGILQTALNVVQSRASAVMVISHETATTAH